MDSSFILFLLFAIGTANAVSVSVDSKSEFGTRIVGGTRATEKDIPYQVSLIRNYWPMCGGSIIDKNHVLTAARCLDDLKDNERLTVRAGSHTSMREGSEHSVIQYTRHEDFDLGRPDGKVNDIAVLKVSPSFEFDETRAPIELFEDSEKDVSILEGQMVNVSGFGLLSFGGVSDFRLRYATVKISDIQNCRKAYAKMYIDIMEDRFCATYEGDRKGTCKGDSGGPVVMNGRQIGITAAGFGCADPVFPDIYTNVAYFAEWIKKQIS